MPSPSLAVKRIPTASNAILNRPYLCPHRLRLIHLRFISMLSRTHLLPIRRSKFKPTHFLPFSIQRRQMVLFPSVSLISVTVDRPFRSLNPPSQSFQPPLSPRNGTFPIHSLHSPIFLILFLALTTIFPFPTHLSFTPKTAKRSSSSVERNGSITYGIRSRMMYG